MPGEYFTAVLSRRIVPTTGVPVVTASARFTLRFRMAGQDTAPLACLWDTGAEISAMSEATAADLGIDLSGRDRIRLAGVTAGPVDARLVPRVVRFPLFPAWTFRTTFAVIPDETFPYLIFGLSDTVANFEVATRNRRVYFFLKPDHRGEPVAAAPERTEP